MLKLRDYQVDCVDSTFKLLGQGYTKLINVLPTGSGKTVIFGEIIKRYLASAPNSKVAVVSHLGLLVEQTSRRMKEDYGIETGIFQAGTMPAHDDRCVITTMQSFREVSKLKQWARQLNMFSKSIDRLNIDLIIIDECHYMGSDSYNKILENFPNAIVLGFTATPFRENKLMSNVFDVTGYTISMQELIDQGYLVTPKLHLTPFDTKDEPQTFKAIIDIYEKNHRPSKEKAVVYCKTIKQAEDLRNIFIDHGITSSAITSKLTGQIRDDTLRDFRNGDGPDVLTTVDVLTAGFDSPNLRAIFMPWKVSSVTKYLQRIGRGLRTDTGKTECDVYVGSDSPGVKKGFWEKITQQMLNAGRQNYDNYLDMLEFEKDVMSKEEVKWTMDTVAMAKAVRDKGMPGLFDMIITKGMPEHLIGNFISCQPPKSRYKKSNPITPKQLNYLAGLGMDGAKLSSYEASAIISSDMDIKGYIKKEDRAQGGKWDGTPYSKVPYLYWNMLAKHAPSSATYKAYNQWKKGNNYGN